MPVPLLVETAWGDLSQIPYIYRILKATAWIAAILLLKHYFGGARCSLEKQLHGKIVMITVRQDKRIPKAVAFAY